MKFFRLSLIFFVSSMLLTSCKATAHTTLELNRKNPVTLSLWHYYNGVQQTALDSLVKEFNGTVGLEKGINIEAFSYGTVNDLSESVRTVAEDEARAMPDMFFSYADSAYALAALDKLANFDNYLTDTEKESFIPTYLNEGEFLDGYMKIFPVAKATEVFMLNLTDWNAFEKSQNGTVSLDMLSTWEGIAEAAEKYYNASGGKALFGVDYASNYFFAGAGQLGQNIIAEDGEGYAINLDKEAVRKLWDNLYVPILKGHFAAYGRFRSDDVKTGGLLAYVGSTSSAAYFPAEINEAGEERPIEAYVAPMPVFNGAKNVTVQQGAGICAAKSNPQRELAAVEFLKWFTDVTVNTEFSLSAAGYFPVKQEAITGKVMDDSISKLQEGEQSDKVLAQVMNAGLLQFETYELLSMPVTDYSEELRNIFESEDDEALAERKALLEDVKGGADYEHEIDIHTGDEAFELWYKNLSERVGKL